MVLNNWLRSLLLVTMCCSFISIATITLNVWIVPSLSESKSSKDREIFLRYPGGPLSGLEEKASGATGTVFEGEKTRYFQGSWRLRDYNDQKDDNEKNKSTLGSSFSKNFKDCLQWAVVTTIFEPGESIYGVSKLRNWCLVIIGDTKTPDAAYADLNSLDNVIYLSARDQMLFLGKSPFGQILPFQSFARKNLGYLFAIRHGAQVIYDFDDDNVLQKTENGESKEPFTYRQGMKSDSILVRFDPRPNLPLPFNPLPYMGPNVTNPWPRGFPLQDLTTSNAGMQSDPSLVFGSIPVSRIGVIQSVCDGDPDVDAIWRMTRELPFGFEEDSQKVLVPSKTFASYNAQATVHLQNSFWAMFLPFSVPGRVTDIWRAYIAQRLFRDINLSLVYAGPLVTHTRTAHNYLADFQAEQDLYMKTKPLLGLLDGWESDSTSLPGKLEALYVALYEHGYVGLVDVTAVQEWLLALIDSGYRFPSLKEDKTVEENAHLSLEPSMHNQPMLASPRYNLGGPGGNVTYKAHLDTPHEKEKSHGDMWQEWVDGVNHSLRPQEAVIKLIMMTKDEGDLLQRWVFYHGELIGYKHLYILDGSTSLDNISFLKYARDHLGVNVIFTPANLNELGRELSAMALSLAGAADFLMKVDTDEFLAVNSQNATCRNGESGNCSTSPYGVIELLRAYSLLPIKADGGRMQIETSVGTIQDRKICEAGRGTDLGQFHQIPYQLKKVVLDARTVQVVDLGGHNGVILPPHDKKPTNIVPLTIIHVHSRCLEHEVRNNEKACRGHGYIPSGPIDPATILKSFENSVGPDPCLLTSPKQIKDIRASSHKVYGLLKHLANCTGFTPDTWYPTEYPAHAFTNPDFRVFLDSALEQNGCC